jgi:AraC family transcriptional regulator
MPAFEFRDVPYQHTAVVHVHCRPDAISDTMGQGFGTVFAAIGKNGAIPVGPVFARYFDFDADDVDFECGAVVAAPFAGVDEVTAGELGGGEAAVGMHIGPYDRLHETYEAMRAWIAEQGRTPAKVMWEVYLSDPQTEPDAARWRTEVYWPVE